jgi:hypothetical protein
MIPTNKFETNQLRIEGTSRTRKTDENSLKKDTKIQRATSGEIVATMKASIH